MLTLRKGKCKNKPITKKIYWLVVKIYYLYELTIRKILKFNLKFNFSISLTHQNVKIINKFDVLNIKTN
jgi:hypothetical protein